MTAPLSNNSISEISRSQPSDADFVRVYPIAVRVTSVLAIGVGVLTVLGWFFQWTWPLDLFDVGITMKANAGLATTLTGFAILSFASEEARWSRRAFGYSCALAVFAIGSLTIAQHLLNSDFGIDQLLASEAVGAASTTSPNRMGPPASISFALLGLALLLTAKRNRLIHIIAQSSALLVCVIAMLSVLGNLYGVEQLFALARYTGISLQTSVALLLLCVGFLCIRPDRGLMLALSSPESGGILVRRLLVPCILLPVLLGWVYGLGVRKGVFDEQFGMAIFMLALAGVLAGLVLWSGASLNRASRLRREAELAVTHNERLYRAIGESINYGIWVCDAQGRNTYVSPSFLNLLGITQEQYLKRGWDELLHPEDADAAIDSWKHCVARGAFWERAHRYRGKNGHWHHILARGVPIRDEHDEIIAWAGINLDISKLKETEDELRRHKDHLEHLVLERTKQLESSHQALRMSERMAAMGTLVAGLGHDMGNLLLPVRARLDVLEHANLPDSAQNDVKSIRACVEHLQQLASGLRLFSLDPESDADMHGNTDLHGWRLEVEPFMRNALPRGVSLLWGIPDGLPPVKISKHRLTQAVYNLVKNAGDAMAARGFGSVAVSARVRDNFLVQFDVSDDGPGMTDEVQRHCLEPFYTTKKRGLSTGLGLSIVHGITQRCGGAIHINSKVGQGSTFTLTMPAGVEAQSDASLGKAVVMIDNPRLSAMVAATLGGEYQVMQSSHLNGADAQLCVAEWSSENQSTIKRFLSGHHDGRALILNCPDDSHLDVNGGQRLMLIAGWPKITDLRRALLQLSKRQTVLHHDVQIKPNRAAASAHAASR